MTHILETSGHQHILKNKNKILCENVEHSQKVFVFLIYHLVLISLSPPS